MSRSANRRSLAAQSAASGSRKCAVAPPTPRHEVTAALADIDIAPENLRHGEAADDQVPQLAATIKAAGLLQYPTARPGRRGEAPWMLLDGRRRLLALRLLQEAGDIAGDHPVRLFVETDRARQAAAAVLTNTAAPVHVADVIAAVGRMIKARLGVAEIASALGYAEVEIRRLAALSALPHEAIDALKAGRLNLKQARLLARLKNRKEQAELARAALDGHGFQEWRLHERLDQDRVTANDARCRLLDPERYVAAGGRLEHDLFGERAPVLLDPDILTAGWLERVRPLAEMLETQGFSVHVSAGETPQPPEDLEAVGWCYGAGLDPEQAAAWKDARDAHTAAVEAVAESDLGEDICAALGRMVQDRIARDQAAVGGRVVTTVVLTPSSRTGVNIECWTPVEPEDDDVSGGEAEEPRLAQPAPPTLRSPVLTLPPPELGGAGHALHAVQTDTASRGLARALADHPEVALSALLARLFSVLVLRVHQPAGDAPLAITPQPYAPTGGRVIAPLDGEVRARLEARRIDWIESGQTAVAWVHALAAEERLTLLAELLAVTVDMREARISSIRTSARAVAAELTALCAFDMAEHWTPDTVFLQAHGKADLVGMLGDMQVSDPSATKLKKAALTARVEAEAAGRRWSPPVLDWAAPLAKGENDPEVEAEEDDAGPGDGGRRRPASAPGGRPDGRGVFVVTPAGEAELRQPAV